MVHILPLHISFSSVRKHDFILNGADVLPLLLLFIFMINLIVTGETYQF